MTTSLSLVDEYVFRLLESDASSQASKLLAARAIKQMSSVASTRGLLVLQGALKCCLTLSTSSSSSPSTSDPSSVLVRRYLSHALAKMLVTTNSTLLPSHQRLDAIRPLLALCREDSNSSLEHFEALLALTNLTSCGASEQSTLIHHKGLKIVFFLMLHEHPGVRRAAVELICNLSSASETVDFFTTREHLKVLVNFCCQWSSPDLSIKDDEEDEKEEPRVVELPIPPPSSSSSSSPLTTEAYKAARASSGALASLTCSSPSSAKLCSVFIMQEKGLESMVTLLASSKYELIHRALVVLENIIAACGAELTKKERKLLAEEDNMDEMDVFGRGILGEHWIPGAKSVTRLLEAAIQTSINALKSMKGRDEKMVDLFGEMSSALLKSITKLRTEK